MRRQRRGSAGRPRSNASRRRRTGRPRGRASSCRKIARSRRICQLPRGARIGCCRCRHPPALFARASVRAAGAGPAARASVGLDRQGSRSRAADFMVAAANPLAVDAGYEILRRGGNAVDAAIAVQLVLGLVEPQIVGARRRRVHAVSRRARRHRLFAYDGRETAPAAARPDRFLDRDGKPLRVLRRGHRRTLGRRSGDGGAARGGAHSATDTCRGPRLFAPAIALAERGFRDIAAPARWSPPRRTSCSRAPARISYDADGSAARRWHDRLRNPAYAATLRTLAARRARRRSTRRRSRATSSRPRIRSHANPGDLTLADLARYRVKVREPGVRRYRGYRVCGMPLPSSGGLTVLQMLKMLEPYDVASMGPASFWSVHFVSEAGPARLCRSRRRTWPTRISSAAAGTARSRLSAARARR